MKSNKFGNNFTYIGGNGNSQIDYVLTNNAGRPKVKKIDILLNDWHISNHRPLSLELILVFDIVEYSLLVRAQDLNLITGENVAIVQIKRKYNYSLINEVLLEKQNLILSKVENSLFSNNDVNSACEILDHFLCVGHKLKSFSRDDVSPKLKQANELFEKYLKSIEEGKADEFETNISLYLKVRKCISVQTLQKEASYWNELLKTTDPKVLWSRIDWKQNTRKQRNFRTPHIKEIYKNDDENELKLLLQLESVDYILVLDDPITESEVKSAYPNLKKSGYDYALPIMNILVSSLTVTLLLLINFMFYVSYPFSLSLSLLLLIPKSGNLALPANYRGVQMMKSLPRCSDDEVVTEVFR